MRSRNVNDANAANAAQIASVIRQAYDPGWLDVMLYGCGGIEHYIEAQIRLGPASSYRYKVYRRAEEVVGVAEFRLLGRTLFLNNIAVLPAGQGDGAGKTLLRDMVTEARQEGRECLSLDVLEANVRAIGWYERLGLQATSKRSYWRTSLPTTSGGAALTIPDYAQAEAVHAQFGFSEFSVEGEERTAKVGRLGTRYFRLVGSQDAKDVGLRAFLGALEPARRLLAILDGTHPEGPTWEPLAVSIRMTAPLDTLSLK